MCRISKIITFLESLRQAGWLDLFESDIQALLIFDPLITYGVIFMPLISNCSMMPAWHQLVSMSGHVEESETARKLQLYATSIYQVHFFVCQLDYEEEETDREEGEEEEEEEESDGDEEEDESAMDWDYLDEDY